VEVKDIDSLGCFAWVRRALDRPSSRVLISNIDFEGGEQHDFPGNWMSPTTADSPEAFVPGRLLKRVGFVPEKAWISTRKG